jgi:hypothetical protein
MAGFKITTQKGVLFRAHRPHLTALPRVSLNGDYQSLTYTALDLSGARFALWNKFQQGQRHLGNNSIGALHPPDQKPCRDDPEKSGGEEEGELHPLRCKRDAA